MSFAENSFIWTDRKRILGMPISFTRSALSEDRLFFSHGFLTIRDEEILLYRIRDISCTRTLGQRLFGVGTITIASSDKSTPTLVIQNIKNPLTVKELLHKNVEEAKLQRRMRIGEVMTSSDEDLADDPE